jgi:hypothetical protein
MDEAHKPFFDVGGYFKTVLRIFAIRWMILGKQEQERELTATNKRGMDNRLRRCNSPQNPDECHRGAAGMDFLSLVAAAATG